MNFNNRETPLAAFPGLGSTAATALRWEDGLTQLLTHEDCISNSVSNLNGKFEIATESAKSFVLNRLYQVITDKISKLDVEYKEILASKGDYTRYVHFKTLDETVKTLTALIKESDTITRPSIIQLNEVFTAHANLIKNAPMFKSAFRYAISSVEQYYLAIVSSIIYAIGFIISSMVDYERKDGAIDYDIVFKNQNILEKGLPNYMMSVIKQFNVDIKNGSIKATIEQQKNTRITNESTWLLAGAIIAGVIALPAFIRYIVYFIMHTKIKLAEYFEAQAAFIALNARRLRRAGGEKNEEIAAKQEEYVERLHRLSGMMSKDKYDTEKIVSKEIEAEDKQITKEADAEEQRAASEGSQSSSTLDDSDILL